MTDQQLLILVISILGVIVAIVAPLTALLYSNSRISDVRHSVDDAKETLRAEIKTETATLRAEIKTETTALRAEMAALRASIDAGFERLHGALKIHELEHHK